MTFIDFIVDPLWETWAELVYPAGQLMLDNMAKTREYWNAKIDPTSSDESGSEESSNHNRVANGPGKEVAERCEENTVSSIPSLVTSSFTGSPVADRRYLLASVYTYLPVTVYVCIYSGYVVCSILFIVCVCFRQSFQKTRE